MTEIKQPQPEQPKELTVGSHELIDGVSGIPQDSASEQVDPRAPIVVSKPGDPGHEAKVAEWQNNQAMLRAAAESVKNASEARNQQQ